MNLCEIWRALLENPHSTDVSDEARRRAHELLDHVEQCERCAASGDRGELLSEAVFAVLGSDDDEASSGMHQRMLKACADDDALVQEAVNEVLLPQLPQHLREVLGIGPDVSALGVYMAIDAVSMLFARRVRELDSRAEFLWRRDGSLALGSEVVIPRETVVIELHQNSDISRETAEKLLGWLLAAGRSMRTLLPDFEITQRSAEGAAITLSARPDPRGDLNALWRDGVSPPDIDGVWAIDTIYTLGSLVGSESFVERVRVQLDEILATDDPLLLAGELGTGKELFARELHARSRRGSSPFVALSCASIPENRQLEELFGSERPAHSRRGHVDLAQGGTLYLCDVDRLSPEVQERLANLLETMEFEPEGATTARRCDARIMAGTAQDPARLRECAALRRDLHDRLGRHTVRLPPLRERRPDILALTRHFVEQFGRRYRSEVATIDERALEVLTTHSWPGNVRELEEVLEKVVMEIGTRRITFADLPVHIRWGGVAGAAQQLGMDPVVLAEKLEKLGSGH